MTLAAVEYASSTESEGFEEDVLDVKHEHATTKTVEIAGIGGGVELPGRETMADAVVAMPMAEATAMASTNILDLLEQAPPPHLVVVRPVLESDGNESAAASVPVGSERDVVKEDHSHAEDVKTVPVVDPSSPPASGQECTRCGLKLPTFPQKTAGDTRCACCKRLYPRKCFSNNQYSTAQNVRRCKGCSQGDGHVLREIRKEALAQNPGAAVANTSDNDKNVKKRKRSILHEDIRGKNVPLTRKRSEALGVSLGFEERVANLKKARRSIQRRREANDLRGSTRLEYEANLAKEESLLDAEERRLKATNHTRFQEMYDSIKIRPPAEARQEPDRERKKKKKKDAKTTKKTKTPKEPKPKKAKKATETVSPHKNITGDSIATPADEKPTTRPEAAVTAKKPRAKSTAATKKVTEKAAKTVKAKAVVKAAPKTAPKVPRKTVKKEEQPASPSSPVTKRTTRSMGRKQAKPEVIEIIEISD